MVFSTADQEVRFGDDPDSDGCVIEVGTFEASRRSVDLPEEVPDRPIGGPGILEVR